MPVAGGSLRAVRGSVVATCCLALSLLAHGLAGGRIPSLGAVVLLGCSLAAVCTWLSGRRWRFATLFAVLAAAQLALHPLFVAIAPPARATATSEPVAVAMTVAHLLAALAIAGVLLRGEDWVHRCAAMLCGRRPSRLPSLPAVVEPALSRLPSAPSLTHEAITGGSVGRRGPPARGVSLIPA